MATPTSILRTPAVIEATTNESSVNVDPHYAYAVTHLSVDTSAAAATGDVMFSTTATITATYAENVDKGVLKSGGGPLLYGPGVSVIYFKSASGSPTFQIQPDLKTVF